MKKLVLATALSLFAAAAGAQTVKDTVSVGAMANGVTYPNQVWYSLSNDVQKTAPRAEWDLAFELKDVVSGVLLNSTIGDSLWKYPKNTLAAGWATVDTNGMKTWKTRINSDTSWSLGAIGVNANMMTMHLDWGAYNMTTHIVTGDSLFVIKLSTGAYRKFAIESLISGVYSIKVADLDGTNEQRLTIKKSDYTDKNFAYLNLRTNTLLDREPAAANWDLLFTQYFHNLGIMYYGVTGVLQNRGVQAVKVSKLPDAATNVNYGAQTFRTAINTIGYDWKTFTGGAYKLADSQLYFVRTANGDIWKMIFTGFGGATDGNFIFTKQKLFTASPTSVGSVGSAFGFVVYPNPAAGSDVQLVADLTGNSKNVRIEICDMSGRSVRQLEAGSISGLQRIVVPAAGLAPGSYIVRMNSGIGIATQRLVIR